MNASNKFLSQVEKYYTDKVLTYGATPTGVDWNGESSQEERFRQVSKVFHSAKVNSVLDYGCGYGAFIDYCKKNGVSISKYIGYDLSEKMIQTAREKFAGHSNGLVFTSTTPREPVDYTISSGIFNVCLEVSMVEWDVYIGKTLDSINSLSTQGFAFNCLTSYSDENKKKNYLYYADPCRWFDYCKKKFSRNVALLHDYGLYEFTIMVRKEK